MAIVNINVNADYPGLPRRLTRLRNRAGLTRQELADHAGVTFNTINDIEKGRRPHPMEKTLQCIARELSVAYEYLAFGDGDANGESNGLLNGDHAERGRAKPVVALVAVAALLGLGSLQVHWERSRPPTRFECLVREQAVGPGAVRFDDVDLDGMVEKIQSSSAKRAWTISEIDRSNPGAWAFVPFVSKPFDDTLLVTAYADDVNGDGSKDLFNVCMNGRESRMEVVDLLTGSVLTIIDGVTTSSDLTGDMWDVDVDIASVWDDRASGGRVAVIRSNTEAAERGMVWGVDLSAGRKLWEFSSDIELSRVEVADADDDGVREVYVWGSVPAGSRNENGSTSSAFAAALDENGNQVWRRELSETCAEVSGALLFGDAGEPTIVFAAVNATGRRRMQPSHVILVEAISGARVDSLPYTDLIVSHPLVYKVTGVAEWEVFCGTQSGMVVKYRVKDGHIREERERWLGRNWVWPSQFVAGSAVKDAFLVAGADEHSYILDRELNVLLNRAGLAGAPISPLTTFADAEGGSYVAFLCHGADVCIDKVVPDSGWGTRRWYLAGYLLPLAAMLVLNNRSRNRRHRLKHTH